VDGVHVDAIVGFPLTDSAVFEEHRAPGVRERVYNNVLGVKHVVVAVNKMDMVGYSQERYEEIVSYMRPLLKANGYRKSSRIHFVPVSGFKGENLTKGTNKMLTWYKGPSMLEIVDTLSRASRDPERPLRMSISDVFQLQHTPGITVAGTLSCGTISKKEKILVMPMKAIATVHSIKRHSVSVDHAYAGDNIEVILTQVDKASIRPGQILCEISSPVVYSEKFHCTIQVVQKDASIMKGTEFAVHLQNIVVPGRIRRIIGLVDPGKSKKKKEGGKKPKKPRTLKNEMIAEVSIRVETPLFVEVFDGGNPFGRIILRKDGSTLAVGQITKIVS